MAVSPRMAQIEELLAAEPDDVMLRYMLGMEYASVGDDAGAVAAFRALLAQTSYVPAYHMVGQALNRLGNDIEACEMLRAGIAAARLGGDTHALGEMEGLLTAIE